MLKTYSHQNARLALLLVVPSASLGALMALYIAPGVLGQKLLLLCYVWLLTLPLVWFFWVERGKFSFSLPQRRELLAGTVLGLLMFGIIVAAYWLFGQHWLSGRDFREKAQLFGITNLNIYLASSVYSVLINSLLEEYVWRWFVCSKCNILISGTGGLLLSALFFTLHHIIGLLAYTNDWRVVLLGSLGVFIAGVLWSWCYLTYRSLWSNYISHAFADLAISLVGWHILFG
jgi:hypothetical protein